MLRPTDSLQTSAKILLPIGIVALLGLGALFVFDSAGTDPAWVEPSGTTEIAGPTGESGATRPGGRGSGVVPDASVEIGGRRETPGAPIDPGSGKGRISGRIGISTRILDKVNVYTIVVQEHRNTAGLKPTDPQPFFKKRVFKARFSEGSPYFDIDDIPFSRHPYKISIVADGVNGSSQHTYVTAESPNGSNGDVQLSLMPGSYFSVRLLDQRRIPRPNLHVRMSPIAGTSLGKRRTHSGKTDKNGYLLFEDVVKGDYEIRVGPVNAPLAPPQEVTVYAGYTAFDPNQKPKTQGAIVTVPDGHDVRIEIWSYSGYPVENAEVKAWQLEVQRYYEFKGTTGPAGRIEFENVSYGTYQLSVRTPHNGKKDLKFKVEKDQPSPTVKVTMSR